MTDTDRPTEIALLAAQLDANMDFFWARLEGLTDDEYLWEPGPGTWNLRPREQRRTSRGHGGGDWVWEYEPRGPQPGPLRTIAWLMWHLTEMCVGRTDWTNGEHRIGPDDVPRMPTAEGAAAQLREAVARWRSVFDDLRPQEYAVVGRSRYPGGLDPDLPLRDILWWQNREIIHHTAEIALLRDLYAWQP
jgi:DinB superfamily